jgi:DNA-binding transcriptional ArsR family regulator
VEFLVAGDRDLSLEPLEKACTPLVEVDDQRALAFDKRRSVRLGLPFVPTYQIDPWTALGDPTRKAIFERLVDRPHAVVELARELPVSRPAVSQHLRVLKDAGLVIDRPVGTRRIYQVQPDGLAALRADLERFWGTALIAYKAVVEQSAKEDE